MSARKLADSGANLRVVPRERPQSAQKKLGVIAEVRLALHPRNRAAAVMGAAIGGSVPIATWWLAHHEWTRGYIVWALIAGGLFFSATTVARWAASAFGSPAKAVGYTVLLEGVLLYSNTAWLTLAALGYLIFINSVASGVQLALEGRKS